MMLTDRLATLAESMRQTTASIATCNLSRLEEILDHQRELVGSLAKDQRSLVATLQQRPEIASDLATQIRVLTSVVSRGSQICRTLLSFVAADEALYSLETLPRR
jgi:hypothetical protein